GLARAASQVVAGRNCVQVGAVWVDDGFYPKMPRVVVKAQSQAYFRILERHPAVKEVFQLGNQVVWVTPNKTALVIDAAGGKEELSDKEIDRLFASAKSHATLSGAPRLAGQARPSPTRKRGSTSSLACASGLDDAAPLPPFQRPPRLRLEPGEARLPGPLGELLVQRPRPGHLSGLAQVLGPVPQDLGVGRLRLERRPVGPVRQVRLSLPLQLLGQVDPRLCLLPPQPHPPRPGVPCQ